MKPEIHPEYVDAEVHCACGTVIKTKSTRKETHVSTCGTCHPFYTGNSKLIDTEGRVERFNKKFARRRR